MIRKAKMERYSNECTQQGNEWSICKEERPLSVRKDKSNFAVVEEYAESMGVVKGERLTKRAFWRHVTTSSGRPLEVPDVVNAVEARCDTMMAGNVGVPRLTADMYSEGGPLCFVKLALQSR